MKKITKKQHYIPQFYLRNYVNKDGYLSVFDRKSEKFFKCKPKDICYSKYLYETPWKNDSLNSGKYILPNEIEIKFAHQENEYNKLIKNIITICNDSSNKNALICNTDEKQLLAHFVANMFVRNPWSLDRADIDIIPNGMMEDEEIQAIDQTLKILDLGGIEPLILTAIKHNLLDENFIGNTPSLIVNDLLSLSCCILVADDSSFITSSFPVVYEADDKLSHIKTIHLPINPRYALCYSDNLIIKSHRNRMLLISKDTVNHINQLYLKHGAEQIQFVISEDDSVLRNVIAGY